MSSVLSIAKVALRNVFEAFPSEAARRAIAGINNRVLGKTDGTFTLAGLAAGNAGTAGIAVANALNYIIDGKKYAGTAWADKPIPTSLGTQGTGCYCKYLVSYGTDGALTFTKGNEAAGSDGAYLPDLPDESCPIGFFVIQTGATHYTAGVGAPATGTTTVGYYDLVSMPITEH